MKKLFCQKSFVWKNASGWCALGWTDQGASFFKHGFKTRKDIEQNLIDSVAPTFSVTGKKDEVPKWISKAAKQIDSFFEGSKIEFDFPLDWRKATDFQKAVWRATTEIPYGKTLTYTEVADAAGSPKGARAAGNALNRNPLPVIVPCHRVLPASGGIGGFATGADVKSKLLEIEGADF